MASSEIKAVLEMFLATTLVLCEAAMNHAGESRSNLAPKIYTKTMYCTEYFMLRFQKGVKFYLI